MDFSLKMGRISTPPVYLLIGGREGKRGAAMGRTRREKLWARGKKCQHFQEFSASRGVSVGVFFSPIPPPPPPHSVLRAAWRPSRSSAHHMPQETQFEIKMAKVPPHRRDGTPAPNTASTGTVQPLRSRGEPWGAAGPLSFSPPTARS